MKYSFEVNDPDQTRAIGAALAPIVRAGDLIMLTGELGSGKTTLTQGLGEAMGVSGRVSSPTFIITRIHPNDHGPDLVHADAYRITDLEDLETLDLDTQLQDRVVVVEWGEGKTEPLSTSRLEIVLRGPFPADGAISNDLEGLDDGRRLVEISPVGPRWDGVDIEHAVQQALVQVQEGKND
ncbi:tRNA (adenosine(37)-N6)-threonylcarbamoyltransferase complex ATPase subunit type 1 TsaE [Gleimia hominis]|uniref:tRNA (adenosine(37)-N6)-threonylcarbamoyltransferase complex ATPase subunit type 1 TsaE n=1 Tax=Gleimia hominis TaxID=595468 RepID=UPI000C80D787|nr:tRNA (adenosine(37)-N6)-threonylcarbamoyltransferase complex ATPase subunit type 1 TsaE [Gleimia hominis]WIK64615.1 tRNA (adenosine(37)-N6)-threonylcarbamoyltransferase complex ATPase subunit type 1 TsaE [Gleimia hominis]